MLQNLYMYTTVWTYVDIHVQIFKHNTNLRHCFLCYTYVKVSNQEANQNQLAGTLQ